jgi:Ca2+-transporting ATPase
MYIEEGKLGLRKSDAKHRLKKFGPNNLPEFSPPSNIAIFLSQIKSPLVYILLIAGAITLFLGKYTDALVIAVAVAINTILGFLQERKANRALYALRKLVNPKAKVIRDGKRDEILLEEVVPGDVCIVNSGDKIPADGKVIYASRFFVSESVLTGESLPVSKEIGDRVFMGTVVTSGNAFLEVEATGKETQVGKIAVAVQEPYEDTPLKRQIVIFSRQLTFIVAGLTLFVFIVGLLSGRDLLEIFTTSVALAVSAIPEGLLIGLTVVLAIGMQRILRVKGLVRNLVSAETLGGVTTICIDKTGTLTEGKMQVTDVIGNKVEVGKQALIANDLDDPLVLALWEWANKSLSNSDLGGEDIDLYLRGHKRLDSIPFTSSKRYFASLNQTSKGPTLFVNGAPEFLLEWSKLDRDERRKIEKNIEKLTSEGKRLVGLAKKRMPDGSVKINETDVKKNLDWVGLVAFSDPVRTDVKESLKKVKRAGVKLIVITGDYAQTAISLLESLGLYIKKGNEILGSELERMSTQSLRERLKTSEVLLFARTTPDQKLKIVKALKENGEVVAMMGDGVNDAPALKHADIGIVVGDATDVAKESADLILLDSSFAVIVSAIEEGRSIFDNIRKIILYLLCDSFGGIFAIVGSLVLELPLPLTAVQILWINLVSDGFPHLSLAVDPKEKNIMTRMPRNPNVNIVSAWMKIMILIVSVASGAFTLFLFSHYLDSTKSVELARSVAFAVLGVNSLIYIFSIRTLSKPFWSENPFMNKWLNLAVVIGFFFQLLPFFWNRLREFFDLEFLAFEHWISVFLVSFVMFMTIEFAKLTFKLGRLED